MGTVRAQEVTAAPQNPRTILQDYDWLKPNDETKGQAATGETFTATVGQDVKDPFAVLASGSLWQDKYNSTYTRQMDDALTLSCETSTVVLTNDPDDLSRDAKVGLQFQPLEQLTLRGNFHNSTDDAPMLSNSLATSGAGFSVDGRLPTSGTVTLGVNSDRTTSEVPSGLVSQTNAYDAQLQQPLGKLPLTAVFKGHFETMSLGGAAPTTLPSLEQSLVWKPLQNTTLQAGLRQQQYQEYPGVDHELNEALFADWSQTVVDNISWHSYAEVLNSKGLLDQAPAGAIASGSNGTPQATVPGSNAGVTSSLPISIDDQTLTFSTGPSFQLQKDLSASVEYSNRWDKNPAPGSVGQEQRVSISLKGTF